MQRSDFNHFVTLPILWGHMDALGHVNNVQFFRYLESGRIAYVDDLIATERSTVFRWERNACSISDGVVLADLQCSFKQQLHYPGTVEIGTRVHSIGRSSLQLNSAIFVVDTDEPAATAKAVIVCFDFQRQASIPVPQQLRDAIVARESLAPIERTR